MNQQFRPGDLVEVDTLDVRPFASVALKQFTGRDVISRWDVIETRLRATATTDKEFLDESVTMVVFSCRHGLLSIPSPWGMVLAKNPERIPIPLFFLQELYDITPLKSILRMLTLLISGSGLEL
jgi:hypothetical protein